jgi:hypothetical protein
MLDNDFYFSFQQQILLSHYHFLKQTYRFRDNGILSGGEMNREFIPK